MAHPNRPQPTNQPPALYGNTVQQLYTQSQRPPYPPAPYPQHYPQQPPAPYPSQQPQYYQPPTPGAPPPPPPGRPTNPNEPWTKYDMTQEEYDHICAVFINFDVDDSGKLDKRELTSLARWLNFNHSPQAIDRMFAEMDRNRSGKLSMDEFCYWMSNHRPDPTALYGLSQQEYHGMLFQFHTFDTNHDGLLGANEFIDLCQHQGWTKDPKEAYDLFFKIDTDRSGTLDLHEMLLYRSKHKMLPAIVPPPPAKGPPQGGLGPQSSQAVYHPESGNWEV